MIVVFEKRGCANGWDDVEVLEIFYYNNAFIRYLRMNKETSAFNVLTVASSLSGTKFRAV